MSEDLLDIIQRHDRFPSFQKPVVLGFYSLDENRQYHPHAKNLKYLYNLNPKRKLDLNIGFDQYVQKVETLENEEKIDTILLWLTNHGYLKNVLDAQVCYSSVSVIIIC